MPSLSLTWSVLPLAAIFLTSLPAGAQGTGPDKAFEEALSHIAALEDIAFRLSQKPDAAAKAALEKIRRRLQDGLLSAAARDPKDRALLAKLRKKSVRSLSLNRNTGALAGVCQMLQMVAGVPIVMTPEARRLARQQALVLEIEVVQPMRLLALLDKVAGTSKELLWRVRDGKVVFTTRAAEAARTPNAGQQSAAPAGKAGGSESERARIDRLIRQHESELQRLRERRSRLGTHKDDRKKN